MRLKFILLALPAFSLSACMGGMDKGDYLLAGPVAPPRKYVPEVIVPLVASHQDFISAAGSNAVFFDTNKAVLTPQARDVLERQALWLMSHRDVNFLLEGHADERAPSTYNLELARRRAEAVKDFFVGRGISANRITVTSFGEDSPVIDNKGDIELNRRVVTVLR